MMKRASCQLLLFLLSLLIFSSCLKTEAERNDRLSLIPIQEQTAEIFVDTAGSDEVTNPSEVARQEPIPEKPAHHKLILVAAGDNLFHDTMIRPSPGGFNFRPYYSAIKPLIEKADLAFINQETLLAGEEFGFSGYPRFNTPQELGLALIDTGFDIINHANNHVMDKGERAVFATMDFWDNHPEITYLGIHRSPEIRNTPIIIEKNNITLGFLSYTYGTNGLPVPRDKPFLVSLIDMDIMEREINAIRPLCDFLIVSMHWGIEYEHTPSAQQRRQSAFLAELGVDLVIGHHPHVLQPMVYIPGNEDNEMLCVYSLGNFLSAQAQNATLLGGLLYLEIRKEEDQMFIDKSGIIPTVTHYEQGSTNFRVYPLHDYTEEIFARHLNRTRSGLTLDFLNNLARTVLGENIINYNPFDTIQ